MKDCLKVLITNLGWCNCLKLAHLIIYFLIYKIKAWILVKTRFVGNIKKTTLGHSTFWYMKNNSSYKIKSLDKHWTQRRERKSTESPLLPQEGENSFFYTKDEITLWISANIKTEIHTLSVQGANLRYRHPLVCQGWWGKNKTVPVDSVKIETQTLNVTLNREYNSWVNFITQ